MNYLSTSCKAVAILNDASKNFERAFWIEEIEGMYILKIFIPYTLPHESISNSKTAGIQVLCFRFEVMKVTFEARNFSIAKCMFNLVSTISCADVHRYIKQKPLDQHFYPGVKGILDIAHIISTNLLKKRMEKNSVYVYGKESSFMIDENGKLISISHAKYFGKIIDLEFCYLLNNHVAKLAVRIGIPLIFHKNSRRDPVSSKMDLMSELKKLEFDSGQLSLVRNRVWYCFERPHLSSKCKEHWILSLDGYASVISPTNNFVDHLNLHNLILFLDSKPYIHDNSILDRFIKDIDNMQKDFLNKKNILAIDYEKQLLLRGKNFILLAQVEGDYIKAISDSAQKAGIPQPTYNTVEKPKKNEFLKNPVYECTVEFQIGKKKYLEKRSSANEKAVVKYAARMLYDKLERIYKN